MKISIIIKISMFEEARYSMAPRASDVLDNLPLKPVDLWILIVLCDGTRHGYGIVKEIEHRTNGHLRLVPGNFYAILARLADQGLIKTSGTGSQGVHERSRRDYGITRLGRKVVGAEIERLRQVVHAAESLEISPS